MKYNTWKLIITNYEKINTTAKLIVVPRTYNKEYKITYINGYYSLTTPDYSNLYGKKFRTAARMYRYELGRE